jgi:ABC-type antimicrobial peptide transport system permease subunit
MVYLVWRWISGARQRSVYTGLSIAVAFFTFVMLTAISAPFARPRINHSHVLNTRNAVSGSAGLPVRYAREIDSVPGVRAVSWFTALPASCGSSGSFITINALGGSLFGYQSVLKGLSHPAGNAWKKDQHALLVGDRAAKTCGWAVGQTVTVASVMSNISGGGGDWTFRIAGIYHDDDAAMFNRIALAHYVYINEGRISGKDTVMAFTEDVGGANKINKVAAEIDRLFAHSYPSTRTVTNTAAQAALAKFGDIRSVVVWILGAVFFCMLLVTVNVMSHAVVERRTALAALNALGFRRRQLAACLIFETTVIFGLGFVVGAGGGIFAVHLLRPVVASILARFAVPWTAIAVGAGLAIGAIIATAATPAVQVVRLRPALHLRS